MQSMMQPVIVFYACTYTHERQPPIVQLQNLMMNHVPGKLTVDHINRNTEDNREVNLRLATQAVQTINQKVHVNNKTGNVGVFYRKRDPPRSSTFHAQYNLNGKIHSKSFSVSKHGYEKAKEMAIEYRKEKVSRLADYIEAYRTQENGIDMPEDSAYSTCDDLEYDYRSI